MPSHCANHNRFKHISAPLISETELQHICKELRICSWILGIRRNPIKSTSDDHINYKLNDHQIANKLGFDSSSKRLSDIHDIVLSETSCIQVIKTLRFNYQGTSSFQGDKYSLG